MNRLFWMVTVLLLAGATVLVAEKESFKKKRAPSLRTLSEQYGQVLTDIMQEMPKLHKQLAKQQKELARLEQEAITALTALLNDEAGLTKESAQKMLDEATKTNKLLKQYAHDFEHRIAELRSLGKQVTMTS